MTPAELIEKNGGAAAIAAKLNREAGAVRAWKHRNKLPRECWPDLLKAFPHLTLDALLKIERHGARKPKP